MSDPITKVQELMGHGEDVDLPEGMAAESRAGDDCDPPNHDRPTDYGDDPCSPDDLPSIYGTEGGAIDGDVHSPDLIRRASALPLNDFGNGQRFALYFGDDVIWVPRVGWFVWNGRLWKSDPDQIEVRRRAQGVCGLIEHEVPFIVLSDRQMVLLDAEITLIDERKTEALKQDEEGKILAEAQARINAIDAQLSGIAQIKSKLADVRKAHRSFARTSGNKGRIDAITVEAGIGLVRALVDLDAAPLDVNTEAGVLRFSVDGGGDAGFSRTSRVELIPHDRSQLLTKSLAVAFDPAAKAPLFTAFIERIMPSAEMRRFLQRWFGYCMTALTSEQKLVFFYGAGANGKSVLVDLMARLMADYAATAKIESLIGKNRRSGGDATPDLIPLVGARFVRASEPEEGERLQEAKIKELTGGEPMLVRGLNADFFEFLPIFKLTISGNHKPDIRGTDDGIWRRLLLVPFDVQIPKAERDPLLVQKLFEERAGILNWMVAGLLDYLEGGLQEPSAVLSATQDYRDESDPVGTMLADATVVSGSETDFMEARTLIEAFQFWQEEKGETRWGNRTVSMRLKEKAGKWRHPGTGISFIPGKSGVTGYRGIRLTDVFQARFDKRPVDKRSSTVTRGDERNEAESWDL